MSLITIFITPVVLHITGASRWILLPSDRDRLAVFNCFAKWFMLDKVKWGKSVSSCLKVMLQSFNWIQVWALVRLLKDFHIIVCGRDGVR